MSAAMSEPLVPLHTNQAIQSPSKPGIGSVIESLSPAAHKRWAATSLLLAAQIRLPRSHSVWTSQPPPRQMSPAKAGEHTVGSCPGLQERTQPRDPDGGQNLPATSRRYSGDRPALLASKRPPVS